MRRLVLLGACVAMAWSASPVALASPNVRGGLAVSGVTVSSTMPGDGVYQYDGRFLVDGDRTTAWQPAGRTPLFSWVRIELAEPAQVDGLVVHNGFQSQDGAEDLFRATARVRRAWVLFDNGSAEVIRLDPANRDGRLVIFGRSHLTRTVTLVVRDVELGERWNHLAISEITVSGRSLPNGEVPPAVSTDMQGCGTPGWVPLRDAVVRHCGAPEQGGACEDPVLDVVLRCRSDETARLELVDWDERAPNGTVSWSYSGRFFAFTVDVVPAAGDQWRVTSLRLTDLTIAGDDRRR